MAPEIIRNQHFDHKVDIWALGVLLYELLHGKVPFPGDFLQEKLKNILEKENLQFTDQISDKAKDLLEKLLKKKPEERIEFQEIFRNPWVESFLKIYSLNLKDFIYENDNYTIKTKSSMVNTEGNYDFGKDSLERIPSENERESILRKEMQRYITPKNSARGGISKHGGDYSISERSERKSFPKTTEKEGKIAHTVSFLNFEEILSFFLRMSGFSKKS